MPRSGMSSLFTHRAVRVCSPKSRRPRSGVRKAFAMGAQAACSAGMSAGDKAASSATSKVAAFVDLAHNCLAQV